MRYEEVKEMKKCPILQAGLMLSNLVTVGDFGQETINRLTADKNSECMGQECEWFGKGCPAHPKK